ncbi:transglutaminase TgpA family protein [Pseudolysinimonas sp.]|uniref:transglutaminase TgpA family protein n=1 Tax=Pseudolysinimonas sp. TaxID=2680009 RepID=UPI003F7E0B0F
MALTETRRPLSDPRRAPTQRRRRPARPRGELTATVLFGLALLSAYAGLHPLLQDLSWFAAGAVFVVLVLASATITRRIARPAWLPTVVAAAVALLGLTAGYAADKALLGVIPTPDVIGRFGRLADLAWLSIAEQALPATPELGIVFLLALLVAGCALFGDLVLRRAPALTAIPLLALLAVPVAVRAGVADALWYVVTAVLYLALIRRGSRIAALPSTLATAAAVVLGSLVIPSLLPAVTPAEQTGGTGIDGAINPLVNLGDDLRRGTAVTALTYSTSSGEAVYLRLATLDRFDGRQWSPSDVAPPRQNTVNRFPAPAGLLPVVERTSLTADVRVGGVTGRWLPVPYPASRVSGLQGDWRYVDGGLSVRSQDTSAGGQKYRVGFVDVQPDLTQLRASDLAEAQRVGDLSLPPGMPAVIAQTATEVTSGATTEYDKALALQNWFQSTGGFTYSETAPVEQGYDGTGAQIIAEFLRKKEGYCVHFASSMAVMARTLGIPARMVVGFQPGSPTTVDGKSVYTVSSHDLHAWPELYFSGIGWLRFEPTPGRGELPVYSQPAAVDDAIAQGATGGEQTTAPNPTASTGGKELNDPTSVASGAATAGDASAARGAGPAPWIGLGVLVVIVALVLGPFTTRRLVRARRERAIARGRDPAANAWAEVRDTARDHGWMAPESETARDFAERLVTVLPASRDAIGELCGHVEQSAYARTPRPISLDELRAVRRSIAATSRGRDAVRAVLLPASLFARLPGHSDE